MSPSAINQANRARRNRISRSATGSVESGRSPRAMRSIVPSYLPEVGKIEDRAEILHRQHATSSGAAADVEIAPRREPAACRPASRSVPRPEPQSRRHGRVPGTAIRLRVGSRSPAVPAGFRMWVKGWSIAGTSMPSAVEAHGRFDLDAGQRGVSARANSRARFCSNVSSISPAPVQHSGR